jgi:hypothetical protein
MTDGARREIMAGSSRVRSDAISRALDSEEKASHRRSVSRRAPVSVFLKRQIERDREREGGRERGGRQATEREIDCEGGRFCRTVPYGLYVIDGESKEHARCSRGIGPFDVSRLVGFS